MPREPAPAKVAYRALTRTGEATPDQLPYSFIDWLVANHLPDLVDVRFGVSWHNNMKPDSDGRTELGMSRLVGDPARQQCSLDVNIILNQEWWHHNATTDEMRKAMLHHQLMHVGVRKDDNGDVKTDELNRPRLYNRKHNVEEFREVISAHGMYVDELAQTYRIMRESEANHPEQQPVNPDQAVTDLTA